MASERTVQIFRGAPRDYICESLPSGSETRTALKNAAFMAIVGPPDVDDEKEMLPNELIAALGGCS